MNAACLRIIFICLPLLLVLPLPAEAITAITCHCFTDRSFEPSRPAAADPYFLATTQNSFFAVVFNTDRKSLVLKKQQGTAADDLWIAYRAAAVAGTSPESLLQARQRKSSWQEVIVPLRLPARALGRRFASGLNAGAPNGRLAEGVVDDLLQQYRLLGDAELLSLRQAGATSQELILAAVLAARTGQSAGRIYLDVKNGSATWGGQLHGAKLDPKEMQREIAEIVKRPR